MKTFLIQALLAVISISIAAATVGAEDEPSLAAKLREITSKFEARAPGELKVAYEKDIAAVKKSGITDKAIAVGMKVPDFELKNATGVAVSLSSLLKNGAVVLTWYRGGWCPYCNATLRAYQEALDEITAAGGQLVALTPELPDKSLSTREKNDLKFEILSDSGQKVARKYGVVFSMSAEVAKSYRQIFDMREYNGQDAAYDELPLAATYVIDSSGVVRWAFVDADYRNRADPSTIVAALK
ncbi:MAG: peroxiredoxin, partial [Verrucomicrobiales bacterium]